MYQIVVLLFFVPLAQFPGMRNVNTIDIQQVNKVMLTAAVAYNLKKYLKFTAKTIQSMAKSAEVYCMTFLDHIRLYLSSYKPFNFSSSLEMV